LVVSSKRDTSLCCVYAKLRGSLRITDFIKEVRSAQMLIGSNTGSY
jgi:hypothetical protein